MEYIVRKAKRTDLQAIYDLVKELAVYEKAPDEVTATLADYQKDFDAGIFESLVIESEGEIMGMMFYYMAYSTWKGRMLFLEDFVVSEKHRRKGIGQILWEALIEEARKKEVHLIKWQVLDWNTPAIKFYEKNKTIIEKEWWNGKVIF